MPWMKVQNSTVEVDDRGFIVDPNDWNRDVANALAESSSLGSLQEDHWRVIMVVRDYYEQYKTAPMLRAISKRTRFSERKLRKLFPRSCRECLCQIAGIPQPTG